MTLPVSIFILCYNESVLIPHTVKHYRDLFPSCSITIYDNESTDDSVKIAEALGCKVISWSSGNINDVRLKQKISNNCWKDVKDGWIITIDMDEWLCATEDELMNEYNFGTAILKTCGINIVGNSNKIDLNDIDLHNLNEGIHKPSESKSVCFLRNKISEMNYGVGCHLCNPQGISTTKSKKTFAIKHMDFLGFPVTMNKYKSRYERSAKMRTMDFSTHYSKTEEEIKTIYKQYNTEKKRITEILSKVTMEPCFKPNDTYLFYDILKTATHYLEYGSGGSSFQAANQENIKTIHSIESDPEWYNIVCKNIQKTKPITLMYKHLNTVPNSCGYPGEGCLIEHAKEYSRAIKSLSETESRRLDMILIDGRFRVACCLNCFDVISNECQIVFDDFINRQYYHVVLEFYDIVRKTKDDVMVVLKKKPDIIGPSRELIEKYELIYE